MQGSYAEREVMLNTSAQSTVWRWVEETMWHKFWDMGLGECFVQKLTQLHLQVSYKRRTTNVLAGKL